MNLTPYLSFILILLLFGCQNGTEKSPVDSSEVSTEEATPVKWVTYKAKGNPTGKNILLVTGDEEYRSEEAMPQLAKILSTHHGFDCTVLFAQNPEKLGIIDPNYSSNIPGLEKLATVDLMILFTRFRSLPTEQMQHIDDYLTVGKPLLAIRTATHAFNFEDATHAYQHYGWRYKGAKEDWQLGFGKLVLGETWYTHHGHHKHQSTRGIIAPTAINHPITNGIADGSIWGSTDVYGIRMPMPNAEPIILGQTINRAGEYDENDLFYGMKETDTEVATVNPATKEKYNPNDPMPPIAWLKNYQIPNGQAGTSFTTTIGSASDMLDEEVRRLMVNATYHLLAMDVPEKADVSIVGSYNPSPYQFHDDAHWIEQNLRIADLVEK
ncbi:MAG: hypothetical protein AAGJ18_01215 [Bacteroidota bacterium]